MKIGPVSTFNSQLLSFYVDMNSIARGGSPCVLAPPSLASEKQMLWEKSKGGTCGMHENAYWWEKN